ncbi:MAG: hypothetical protein Q7S50_00650 [bacterium]|nr:hypothetical protein [bacterium]
MNIIRNSAVMAALVLSLGFALPAFAQGAYGTIDSKTQGTVDVGTARVGADADINVKVNANVKASSSPASGSSDIRVQGGDVNGDGVAGIAATGTSMGDPDFDLAAMQAESAEDHVALTSKQSVKLFGFIPVTVKMKVNVDANGDVTVSYPWWTFLAVTNRDNLESKIEAQTKVITAREAGSGMATGRVAAGDVSGDGVEASVKLSADIQARLIESVQAALQFQWKVDTQGPTI